MTKYASYRSKSRGGLELLIPATKKRLRNIPHQARGTTNPPIMLVESYAIVGSRR